MEKRLSMLKEIQALEFFAIELNLFLDTHPGDRAALRDFYAIREKLFEDVKRYEEMYGPLTVFGNAPAQCPWPWIEDPWPWEIEYK